MLDRMYKGIKGQAPAALEELAQKIIGADGFVFVTGEYNWGIQPGLKNLTDHFLEEWFLACGDRHYSARFSGAQAALAWHGTLSEMGMVVTSTTIAVRPIGQSLSETGEPIGDGGKALVRAFPRFADDLMWWVEAARAARRRNRRTSAAGPGGVDTRSNDGVNRPRGATPKDLSALELIS